MLAAGSHAGTKVKEMEFASRAEGKHWRWQRNRARPHKNKEVRAKTTCVVELVMGQG